MKLSDNSQPVAYVLVGLPGSGKTTWINNRMNKDDDYVVISSDDEIEKYAKSQGLTYSDVFSDYVKTATSLMQTNLQNAIRSNSSIIWDQTNMSSKKRKGIVQQIPKHYNKIAVVFELGREELENRLNKREKETGKHIPLHVIDNMEMNFTMPTEDEGFNRIIMAYRTDTGIVVNGNIL